MDFFEALIKINLGLIFLVLDLIAAAVAGEWIIAKFQGEGKSTTLDEEDA